MIPSLHRINRKSSAASDEQYRIPTPVIEQYEGNRDFKTGWRSAEPGSLICLAMLHYSDRHTAAARTFKRALLLIWSVGLNSRKPHVCPALGAPRAEDALGNDFRFMHQVLHRWPLRALPARSAQRPAGPLRAAHQMTECPLKSSRKRRLYGLMDRYGGKVFPQILASPFVRDL